MPARVIGSNARETSTPSDSEKSFVSAESDNTSSKGSFSLGQSAPPSSSLLPSTKSSAPTNFTASKSSANGVSSFASGQQLDLSPTSKALPAPTLTPGGSYFAQQPGASGVEPRSPLTRRPPASRSSHGIETSSGPPPALSTQRSYNADSPWRITPSTKTKIARPTLSQRPSTSASIDSIVKQAHQTTNEDSDSSPSVARVARSKSLTHDGIGTAMAGRHNRTRSEDEEDQNSTIRMSGTNWNADMKSTEEGLQDKPYSSNEDLFLNLARAESVVDDASETSTRRERRRSHIGTSSFPQARTSRPSSSGRPSTSGASFAGQQVFPKQIHHHNSSFDSAFQHSAEKGSLGSLRDVTSGNKSYAASAHPLDQRFRTRNARTSFGTHPPDGYSQEGSPDITTNYGRRRSLRETSPGVGPRSYKQSNLSYTTNGNYSSSPFPDRSSQAHGQGAASGIPLAAGTESTVSTTAPSTVWDELDELKSRLRKLELTGALPNSSNAAMSNALNERPPTATTTMTTMSSSPKHRKTDHISSEPSTTFDPGLTNIHPLLHSALAKAKPAINAKLYRALEATATDALKLASMTGSSSGSQEASQTASVVGPASGIDRQLRRKADNMCRSLTELCIALAEELPEAELPNGKPRPGSNDGPTTAQRSNGTLPDPRLLRGASLEPEARASSRVMSRLEARRTSLLSYSPLYGRRESTQEGASPTQTVTPVTSRLDRTSTVTLRSRAKEEEEGVADNKRPSSRATTEIGQLRPSPQTRISREYTSQHPMPKSSDRSPSVQSSLPPRKSYFSQVSTSPLTPTVQPGNRRYLDRSTPPSSADSARLTEARQRRIASLGQHTSAGQSRIGISTGRLRQSEGLQQR